MTNKVELSPFTDCCGIFNLHCFFQNRPRKWLDPTTDFHPRYGYHSQDDVDKRYNIPQGCTEDTEEKWISRVKRQTEEFINNFENRKSYFLAAMNREESEVLEATFLDMGWEILVPETKNPTGTAITLYIYHLLPRDQKPVESILKKA